MYDSTGFMSSSERLVAFLDGELSQEHTSTLFYELAQNSELQDEMRQYVQLRNTLRNSQVTPPPHLKNNILKSTGLAVGPLAALRNNGTKAATMLMALLYNRASLAVLALLLLSVATVFYLNQRIDEQNGDLVDMPISKSADYQQSVGVAVPVSESVNDLSKNANSSASSRTGLYNARANNKLVNNNFVPTENTTKTRVGDELNSNILGESNEFRNNEIAINNTIEMSKLSFGFPIGVKSHPAVRQSVYSKNSPLNLIMQNTSFYIKQFSAQSYPNISLANENNPLLNNISIGLKYNMGDNHSIGLAGGMENFLMTFDKESDGILYRYDQSWNGYWLALTYHYSLGEIGNTSVYPELSFIGGTTVVGPIFRGNASANYFVSDSFYLNIGIEAGALLYREKQSNSSNKWFSTEKVGLIVGFGIGL